MQRQTLLKFHANQKVKLPLILQFPFYKASTKTWKLFHKTHLTSSPFPDVLWQRMMTVLDVLFLLIWSALYPLHLLFLQNDHWLSRVYIWRLVLCSMLLILTVDAHHYVIDTMRKTFLHYLHSTMTKYLYEDNGWCQD